MTLPETGLVRPIWIARTRSFWFGILPAILTLVDVLVVLMADPGTAGPVAVTLAAILSLIPGVSLGGADLQSFVIAAGPVYGLIVGHQRRGSKDDAGNRLAPRPYSLTPTGAKQ